MYQYGYNPPPKPGKIKKTMRFIVAIIRIIIVFIGVLMAVGFAALMIYGAFFWKIPAFDSLDFIELKENQYQIVCEEFLRGKSGAKGYRLLIYCNLKEYNVILAMSERDEFEKLIDEISKKNIRIWYKETCAYFYPDRCGRDVYQLGNDNKILISYQETYDSEKSLSTGGKIALLMTFIFSLYGLHQRKKRKLLERYDSRIHWKY